MSQTIKLKRSAVAGKVPTTGSLQLGEVAVNTYDGKVYLKKDDGIESIQSFVITDSTTTGSINLHGNQFISGTLFLTGSLSDVKQINFDTSDSETLQEGQLGWNSNDGTLNLGLNGGNVTLQIGQEVHYRVRNQSGVTIPNGAVVYVTGANEGKLLIDQFVANDTIDHELVLGVATEDIPDNSNGYVTRFGQVRDLNTSQFNTGDLLFAHPTLTGSLTNIEPAPPSQSLFVGYVLADNDTSGSIQVQPHYHRKASEIAFYNSGSNISATNVGAALRELDANKASIDALSSNIYFYSTNATSSYDNSYFRIVTSQDDTDYPSPAVNIPTGIISGSNQFIAKLISDDSILTGNPGTISITTFGNVRRSGGSSGTSADFYFEVYKESGSIETLIGTSNTTTPVNETTFEQFSATAVITPISFTLDDRIVLKYYGNLVDGTGQDPSFQFQFGGNTPVTTLFPVPVSVIPSIVTAENTPVVTTNFNNILSGADDTVQQALETLDDHSHTLQEISDTGNTTSNQLNLGGLEVDGGTLYVDSVNDRVGINKTSPNAALDVDGNTIITGSLTVTNGIAGTVTTASYVDFTNIDNKPTLISGSGQIATEISGAFTDISSSFSSRVGSLEQFSSSLNATFATDLELSQISASLALGISTNDSRLDTLENKTLLSSSAQIASEISGAFSSTSASITSTVNSLSQSFADGRLKNTTDTLTGDLTVTGKITAQEFHTEFISSSIIYESGSTKFGDTLDDIHQFTGSVQIDGTVQATSITSSFEGTYNTNGVSVLDTALAYAIALG